MQRSAQRSAQRSMQSASKKIRRSWSEGCANIDIHRYEKPVRISPLIGSEPMSRKFASRCHIAIGLSLIDRFLYRRFAQFRAARAFQPWNERQMRRYAHAPLRESDNSTWWIRVWRYGGRTTNAVPSIPKFYISIVSREKNANFLIGKFPNPPIDEFCGQNVCATKCPWHFARHLNSRDGLFVEISI